jgi:hypothetical protein
MHLKRNPDCLATRTSLAPDWNPGLLVSGGGQPPRRLAMRATVSPTVPTRFRKRALRAVVCIGDSRGPVEASAP